MANIDKIIKSKNLPKQTNVAWVDLSGEIPVEKHFINGRWVAVSGGGGSGTTDYSKLTNKPSINGVELDGNKTSQDLGVYSKPSSGIPESDLSSDVQSQLNKRFKGWFSSLEELKSAHTAVEGDSAYVKDASPATTWSIYVYDATATTDNNWADSGTDADTTYVQTFASGEEVNEVHIVKDFTTGGEHDVSSAKQGLKLRVSKADSKAGTNLIDPKYCLNGKLLNGSGNITDASSVDYKITDFIPVNDSQYISIKLALQSPNVTLCVYDENFDFIRSEKLATTNYIVIFEAQSGDAYIRANIKHVNVVSPFPYAWYGNTPKDYEEYCPIGGYISSLQSDVDTMEENVDGLLKQEKVGIKAGTNLIDRERCLTGVQLNRLGNLEVISSSAALHRVSNYIPVTAGETVIICGARRNGTSATNYTTICTYDLNKGFIERKDIEVVDKVCSYTPVSGDAYIRVNLHTNRGEGMSEYIEPHANYGTSLQPYEPFNPVGGYFVNTLDPVWAMQQLSSMFNKVICIGDSMTQGRHQLTENDKNSYPFYMSKMSGWEVINAGFGGYTSKDWWNKKKDVYASDIPQCDAAIVYLGQNVGLTDTVDTDIIAVDGESAPGTNYTNYADNNTGCYGKIIAWLKSLNPTMKIYMIKGTGRGLSDLAAWIGTPTGNAIDNIAEYFSVPVFNVTRNSWDDLSKVEYHPWYNQGTSTRDKVHYGEIGYNALGRVIYSYILTHISRNKAEFSTFGDEHPEQSEPNWN